MVESGSPFIPGTLASKGYCGWKSIIAPRFARQRSLSAQQILLAILRLQYPRRTVFATWVFNLPAVIR